MEEIRNYFLKNTELISYIDIKAGTAIYDQYPLLRDVPLPILTQNMLNEIVRVKEGYEVRIEDILEGIIYNLAIDPSFPFITRYVEILQNFLENPVEYIISKGHHYLRNGDPKSIFCFRAAYLLDSSHPYAAYYYACDLYEEYRLEEKKFLKAEAVQILDELISTQEEFAPPYFELGKIYAEENSFLKATGYLKKGEQYANTPEISQEFVRFRESIENETQIEEAMTYYHRSSTEKALEILDRVIARSERSDAYYYKGSILLNSGLYEEAVDALRRALLTGGTYRDLYNDLAVAYSALNDTKTALKYANQGIELYETDLRLRYNRAVLLLSAGLQEKALEDLDYILQFDDISDEIFNEVLRLKEEALKNTR